MAEANVCSKVELSISCTNLKDLDRFSKSDPVVFLFEKKAQQWVVLARTEVIDDNLNPKFANTIIVDYRFEELQQLKFACYDADNKKEVDNLAKQELIGEVECTMAEIVTAGQKYERKLRLKGKPSGDICINAEEVSDTKFEVTLQLSANGLDKKDFFGKSDPYFEVSKVQEGGSYTPVYRSQPIMKNLNPRWPSFTLSSQKLCSGDWDRTLRFSVWDWDSDGSSDFIGETTTTLRDIVTERGGKVTDLELINPELKKKKRKYTNSGTLLFTSVKTTPIHSFMDYIKGGCQISLIVAIDFTASNGKPQSPNSLHYMDPYRDNEYVTAIKSVGSVLTPYDSDNQFPVFGFGAKFRHNGEVSHSFPLNFNPQQPEVFGVQGILDSYHYALGQVDLYGPTNFAPILDMSCQYATTANVSQANQQYYILLIITDGEITDMEKTIQGIVGATSLPLSIVIVGVGDANFEKMETLDADDTPLVDKYGKKMERDIVQFVPFRAFRSRGGATFSLARETLSEIPNQFVGFMKTKKIVPNPPVLRRQQPTTYGGGGYPPQQQAPYPSGGPAPYPTGPPASGQGPPGPAPYPTGPPASGQGEGPPGPAPYPTGPPASGQGEGPPGPAPYPTGPPASGQGEGPPGPAPYPTGPPASGQGEGPPGPAPYPTGPPASGQGPPAPYPTGPKQGLPTPSAPNP